MRTPEPGAVVVLGGAAPARRLSAAIQGERIEHVEGRLALAFARDHRRALHVDDGLLCLFEGSLHEHPELAGPPPGDAARAAAALARAFARRGEAILPELRGSFWALLWDRARGSGIAVCDQLGTRAPYFTVEDGALICASELPELLRARRREPPPDPVALAHWLMMTTPPRGATLYSGVCRLEAGHLLELETARPRRYWTPAYREPRAEPREELVARVRDALERAVTRRLGERTGILLSGGLDSSAVAAVCAASHYPTGYSVVFPEHPVADESELIDRTVRRLGIASARMAVTDGSVLGGAQSYLEAWSLPPTSPNLFFWVPLLERAAANGVTVMLDGEGGDEVFGFSPYLLADRLRQGRVLSAVRLAGRWPGRPAAPPPPVIIDRVRRYGLRGAMPPAAHLAMRRLRAGDAYAPPWLERGLARAWLESEESAFAWKRLDGPRWWAFHVGQITRGPGVAAVYEQARRRAALAGLDAEHPLVDVDLIELMLSSPPELAFDRRHSRPLLREALAGRLDEAVRLRPYKSSFDVVFHEILSGRDLDALRRLLSPAEAELGAYVDLRAVESELFAARPARHPRGLQRWALTAWRLATAELWLRLRSGRRFKLDRNLECAYRVEKAGV